MTENGTTRQIHSFGADNVNIYGLTKGPSGGWTWDGTALSHPIGIRMVLAPAAAQRVSEATAAYRPAVSETLTGIQIQALPDAERAEWQAGCDHATRSDDDHNGYHYGGYTTDDGVHIYTRVTTPTAGMCEFDTTEIVEIIRGR
jgi:hypothetical protein